MAGETGLARYAVKSATMTYGGVTYDIATGPVMKGETREAVDVTALADQKSRFIRGALAVDDEFTVTTFSKASGNLTVSATPAACVLTTTFENGVQDDTLTVTYSNAIITKVSPASIDASGDRKATYEVTIKPDGSDA